ncbi:MAG: hypothetical protein ABI456_23085 [Ktedonobacteraceae bacterium]
MDEQENAREITEAWRKAQKPILIKRTIKWFFILVVAGMFLYICIGWLIYAWSRTWQVDQGLLILMVIGGPILCGIILPVILIVNAKDIIEKWVHISQGKYDW